MRSQLQFVHTHISVQVVRGSKRGGGGGLRIIYVAHSIKILNGSNNLAFSMYSLENIITSKYSLHKSTFLANFLAKFLDLRHLFFAN